jgi:ATP-dependent exoDNAse (exonuclease V) alpha subunit
LAEGSGSNIRVKKVFRYFRRPRHRKTYTVIKILTLLLEQSKDKRLRIALAAPTGKGATRLQEAIKNSKNFSTVREH